ncbi:MAG: potassium channel protein [Chloroflexi bacterium]|nr:potassium channel protein [Chloroflexota bacterium]
MNNTLTRRIHRLGAIAVLLFLVTVGGYMVLEQYPFIDALYMAVITFSTVGYGEVHPLSPTGRLFTALIILVGVGTGAYLFGTIAEYIVAGELEGTLKQRRIMRKIETYRDHYILCGYGRIGKQVAEEMRVLGLPFVVVDIDPKIAEHCQRYEVPYIIGDATEDEVLQQAGVKRARGLVAALDTDADNLFAVISARNLNPDMMIVARAIHENVERKFLQAGADRVVSPYTMAAHRIVSLLVRPNVIHFLDTALRSQNLELWLEEVEIMPDSPLVGKTLEEAAIRARTGANILAIIRPSEHRLIDWSPNLRLQAGDILIVLGKREQLEALARLAGDPRLTRPSRWREVVQQISQRND